MASSSSSGDFRSRITAGKELAARLSPMQKIALGAATLTVVAGAFVLTRSGGAGSMSALYTDLDAADASAVVDELAGRGVPYELTDSGHTVLVPQDQVYDLRVSLAGEGLPASNEGYALLDDQGLTTTEFQQRVGYQRALEGELNKTLRAMDGIQSASVHLAIPEESVFVDEPSSPTASVLVVGSSLGGITGDEVDAIVHLVSSSVRNMKPADVTVVDANGTVLSVDGATGGGTSGASGRTKVVSAFENELASSITALLSRTTGPNKVAVTVSADLDLDERQSTSEDFGQIEGGIGGDESGNGGVVSERTSSEIYGPGAEQQSTGVLGPDGATVSDEQEPVAEGGYVKEDAERNYALDRVVEQTTRAPGAIRELNVAVLLDDQAVTEAQAVEIEKIVTAAAGIDPDRGDTVVVTRMPFDTSAQAEATELIAAEAAALEKSQQMELIRTGAVVFVVIIALLLGYRSARRARRVTVSPIDIGEITAGARVSVPTPELVAVGAPAPPQPSQAALLLAGDRNDDAMGEISQIAERRPEDVANILRTWLAESKGRR